MSSADVWHHRRARPEDPSRATFQLPFARNPSGGHSSRSRFEFMSSFRSCATGSVLSTWLPAGRRGRREITNTPMGLGPRGCRRRALAGKCSAHRRTSTYLLAGGCCGARAFSEERSARDVVELGPAELGSVASGLGVGAAVAVMGSMLTAFGGTSVGGDGCGVQDCPDDAGIRGGDAGQNPMGSGCDIGTVQGGAGGAEIGRAHV